MPFRIERLGSVYSLHYGNHTWDIGYIGDMLQAINRKFRGIREQCDLCISAIP